MAVECNTSIIGSLNGRKRMWKDVPLREGDGRRRGKDGNGSTMRKR